eukprot:TRINITY_DN2368_c0_g2_i1.p1 TRINITY_DN2368_c0_g2~~TRINITY_DN2368_c0_g2_i1.p1  ORF type:complete len:553 (+),score=63.74 TRINITY_DN2368_c0_g2_i1:91-1749(+)
MSYQNKSSPRVQLVEDIDEGCSSSAYINEGGHGRNINLDLLALPSVGKFIWKVCRNLLHDIRYVDGRHFIRRLNEELIGELTYDAQSMQLSYERLVLKAMDYIKQNTSGRVVNFKVEKKENDLGKEESKIEFDVRPVPLTDLQQFCYQVIKLAKKVDKSSDAFEFVSVSSNPISEIHHFDFSTYAPDFTPYEADQIRDILSNLPQDLNSKFTHFSQILLINRRNQKVAIVALTDKKEQAYMILAIPQSLLGGRESIQSNSYVRIEQTRIDKDIQTNDIEYEGSVQDRLQQGGEDEAIEEDDLKHQSLPARQEDLVQADEDVNGLENNLSDKASTVQNVNISVSAKQPEIEIQGESSLGDQKASSQVCIQHNQDGNSPSTSQDPQMPTCDINSSMENKQSIQNQTALDNQEINNMVNILKDLKKTYWESQKFVLFIVSAFVSHDGSVNIFQDQDRLIVNAFSISSLACGLSQEKTQELEKWIFKNVGGNGGQDGPGVNVQSSFRGRRAMIGGALTGAVAGAIMGYRTKARHGPLMGAILGGIAGFKLQQVLDL